MITFRDMVQLFKRIWWKICLLALCIAVIASLGGFLIMGRTYTANVVLFVNVGGSQSSADAETARMTSRAHTVMSSDDYRDHIVDLGGDNATMQNAQIVTDSAQGSISVTFKSKVKGAVQNTADALISSQMINYVADKVADSNKTISTDNFTLVSTPKEKQMSRGTSLVALGIGGFLVGFIVSYLVALAVMDYKRKPVEEQAAAPETPAE